MVGLVGVIITSDADGGEFPIVISDMENTFIP